MARKIVFINQGAGYLTIDIINAFVPEFDQIALITGYLRIQEIPLNAKVHVSKIVKYNRKSNLNKVSSWLLGTLQTWVLLITRYRNWDRFYFTIPPTAYLLSLYSKTRYSITVYDLYPEALLLYKFSREGMIYRWWVEKNKRLFSRAHKVYTISEALSTQIKQYIPASNIKVIPNWSAFSGFKRVEKHKNILINKTGLNDKFIVQYSGNIGASHNVEVLIDVAERLICNKNIFFLIIGRGERSEIIGNLIEQKGLTNCLLLSFRKDEELYDSLCAADLSVVTLDDRIPDISVPSKIYNIMGAGTPVMAIASPVSSIAKIISYHKIGRTFDKLNISGMCQFIEQLSKDLAQWKEFSDSSLQAALDYTNANALKYLEYYNENNN